MQDNNKFALITVATLIVVVVAGYLIGTQVIVDEGSEVDSNSQTEQDGVQQMQEEGMNTGSSNFDNDLPVPPGPDATDQEKQDFASQINDLAVNTQTISINEGCEVSPRVARVNIENSLSLENQDSNSPHTLRIGESVDTSIPGRETIEVESSQFSQPGVFGVLCDMERQVGYVWFVSEGPNSQNN